MTLQTALIQGTNLLEDAAVGVARLTAEVLLMHAVHHDRSWLYAHPEHELSELEWIHYGRYLHERIQGKPTNTSSDTRSSSGGISGSRRMFSSPGRRRNT